MIRTFEISNPYNPQDGLKQKQFNKEVNLLEVGKEYHGKEWLCVAYLDGKRYFPLHDEWEDITLKRGDSVYFMPHVGDPITLIIIAVVAIVAVVVALSLAVQPPDVADQPEPDPVFDLRGQKNQNRLGHPIEDGYGRVRLWPSYATRAYNQYYGNDQYQYQLFCLGHGSWAVESVLIEDTPIGDFQEVQYAIYQPGQQVTLFPDNVESSVEVGNIELYGPNESEYQGVTGPFIANAVNTLTNRLEVDLVLPKGLYFSNDDGGLDQRSVRLLFQYREVDAVTGNPVGSWQTLIDTTRTLATNTPQRYTFTKDVPQARYEVQARRVNNKDESHRAGNTAQWAGLRAFLPSTRDYGDVTMLAVRARATNNLNDQSSNRVNCVATRKLPNYNSSTNTFAALDDYNNRTATRNPVWALVNILRANYGAALEERFLDIEFFETEANYANANQIYFDWVYDQRSTVWEAIKTPAFAMRAIPMLNGSKVSFVRDQPQTLPTFFINPENTVANSFKLQKRLFDLQEQDGLEVEYIDPDSWKPETVDCLLPGEAGNNKKRIQLKGIIGRQQAYDMGMYLWAKESYERDQVTVKTGMEGYIPTYGDLGRFASDIPRWGQTGYIEDVQGNVITLSEPVEFIAGETHQLAIRGKIGQDLGPYTVTAGDQPNQVLVATAGTLPGEQFYFDYQNEPPYFTFGVSALVGKICRVVDLRPDEGEGVTIKAIVDDQRRHADFGTAPPLNQVATPPTIPNNPTVTNVTVEAVPNSTSVVTVSWQPALGAVSYILETSSNGSDWTQVDTVVQTNYTLPIVPGLLYVRVAGVNVGIGAWSSWTGQVGQVTGPPNDVTGLEVQPAFTGAAANFEWQSASQATSYIVKIFTDGVQRVSVETQNTEYDWTIDVAQSLNAVNREVTIEVTAKNSLGTSTPATITATNPVPVQIASGLSNVLKADNGTTRIYTVNWPVATSSDVSFYRVWGSEIQGFTPDAGNLKFQGLATGADIEVTDTGSGFPPLYWRVSAVDIWGDEVTPSPEQTIV